jgi:hypothetical protein
VSYARQILIRERGWFGLKFTDPVEVMAPLGTMAYRMCFAYNEI